jgi:tetratricopeptide (TPR) repeat protein
MKASAFTLLLLTAPLLAAGVAAQNALGDAKAQYEAAAYEEALATLTRAAESAPANRVEVEQYRVLCLLALGNVGEAERAVAALVDADPTYVMPATLASPKILSTIADMRGKQLPTVARRLLNEGRAAFENKDFTQARRHFDILLTLTSDPAMNGTPGTDDLRALAQGFATLAAAAVNPPPPAGPSAAPPPPAATDAGARPLSAAAASDLYVAAVPINQRLPNWEPPSAVAQFHFSGSLRLRIGADGKVKAATIEKTSHPVYDARLLEVAPTWTFDPATRNGVPIESEKTIAIRLQPIR